MANIQKLNVNNTTYDISTTWSKVTGKPSTFTPSSHTHDYLPLSGGTMANQNVVVNLNADLLDGYSGSAYAKKTDLSSYLPLSGGVLTGDMRIQFGNTDKFIIWDYDGDGNAGASWRIGSKGSGSGNTNYFCIESGTSSINVNAWNNVLNIGQNDFIVYFSQTPKVGSTNVSLEGHTHDDRYYTESEVNTKLSGKSDTGHTHSNYVTTDTAQTITGAKTFNNGDQSPITLTRSSSDMVSVKFVGSSGTLGYLGFMGVDQPMYRRVSDNAYLNLLHSGNSSVSKSGETLTVTINGVSKSLTNTNTTYTSLKNPYSLSVFGVSYDGSSAKTLTGASFGEGTSNLTDGTMLLTSYASDNGFADTNAPGTVYKRKASCVWGYIQGKTDAKYSLIGHTHSGYASSSHTHDDRYYTESEVDTKLSDKSDTGHTHNYLPLTGGTVSGNINATRLTINADYGVSPVSQGIVINTTNNTNDYGWNPGIGFHIPGITYGTIKLTNDSLFRFFNSELSGYFGIVTGNITTYGNISASEGFYQSSDERLKTFHDPIKVDLEKLKLLKKNYFKFNDKDKLEIGVSAQEIQSLYPEIVSENSDGYLSVAYDKLSVIALAAIDELDNKYQKEINDLKDQLKAIKNILNEKGIN